jgi:hypothetical protein
MKEIQAKINADEQLRGIISKARKEALEVYDQKDLANVIQGIGFACAVSIL